MTTDDLISDAMCHKRGEEYLVSIVLIREYDNMDCVTDSYSPDQYGAAMHKACETVVFADCDDGLTDTHLALIVKTADGLRTSNLRYAGWMPDMEVMWEDPDGEVVWDACYPEWDH